MTIPKILRSRLVLAATLFVTMGLVLSGVSQSVAANNTEQTIASLTLSKNLDIDRKLEPFRDPALIRIKARVAPPWRGPLGRPPWTERRFCPTVDLISSDDIPPFC